MGLLGLFRGMTRSQRNAIAASLGLGRLAERFGRHLRCNENSPRSHTVDERAAPADNPGMSNSPARVTLPISPWWGLLLFPFALFVGWLAGQAPVPASPVASSTASGAARSAELSQWTTLDQAVAESGRNGKPILIDFNAEWCGPCQALKQQVFEDPDNGRLVQAAVIPVSIVDRAREDGSNTREVESLQQKYQVEAFPTLVVYSPATGRVQKTRGFGGAEATLSWIRQAVKAVR